MLPLDYSPEEASLPSIRADPTTRNAPNQRKSLLGIEPRSLDRDPIQRLLDSAKVLSWNAIIDVRYGHGPTNNTAPRLATQNH
ncbi:hypothetical protein V6N13_064770 [Hibiscus sabdariffa]